MAADPKPITVICPDCHGELTIDRSTGAILRHKKAKLPPGGGRSFEDLFEEMEQSKGRSEQIFEQEQAALGDRERLMKEKFDAALERAEEEDDDEPPPRPFDLD